LIPFIHIINFTDKPANSDQQGWAATPSQNINSLVYGLTWQLQLAGRSLKQRHQFSGDLIFSRHLWHSKSIIVLFNELLHQKRSDLLSSSRQYLGNIGIFSSSLDCDIRLSKWQTSPYTTTLHFLTSQILFSSRAVTSFRPNPVRGIQQRSRNLIPARSSELTHVTNHKPSSPTYIDNRQRTLTHAIFHTIPLT
jgi:hypothetical protein